MSSSGTKLLKTNNNEKVSLNLICSHPLGVKPSGNKTAKSIKFRQDSLGLLSAFNDGNLFLLFNYLTAEDLGILSCCSKALYCFISEEEIWRNIATSDQRFSPNGILKINFYNSWKESIARHILYLKENLKLKL